MKSALVLFNGIRFPFYLVDHVIAWAKTNNGSLQVLFIKAKHREKEGYVFPSDMDAAEDLADTKEAEHGDTLIIRSQMKLLEDMANTNTIPFHAELLTDPALEDILAIAKKSAILFVDADFNEAGILAVTRFTLKDLLKKSPCPVETIPVKTG